MFTEAEIEIIEKMRPFEDKAAVAALRPIRVRITGESDSECGCSSARRKVWLTDFYEWYEAQNR